MPIHQAEPVTAEVKLTVGDVSASIINRVCRQWSSVCIKVLGWLFVGFSFAHVSTLGGSFLTPEFTLMPRFDGRTKA